MNELYGLQDISDEDFLWRMKAEEDPSRNGSYSFRNEVRATMMVPEKLIMAAVKDIYNGTIKEGDISPELFEGISKVIRKAAEKGTSQSSFDPDKEFKRQLLHSADVFSAFKVHSAQQAMAAALVDSEGNLRSFRDFKEAVLPIASHQCGRWLRTEYDTAVIRAHQAADWQQYVEEADVFPNLEWMPSTSVNPGSDHQVFWHTILPINDPFWSQHRPGDRWNCKCSLRPTDKAPSGRPSLASPVNTDPQPGLDSNPGKTKELFSQSHPYFAKDCNSCPFSSASATSVSPDGSFRNQTKDCMNCRFIDRSLPMNKTGEETKTRRRDIQDNSDIITSRTYRHEAYSKEIHITKKGVKEWLNQPHCHYAEKNELILDIDGLLKGAHYVGSGLDKKDKTVTVHLFEVTILGDKSWVIVREHQDGIANLYSISDSQKIVEYVTKKRT